LFGDHTFPNTYYFSYPSYRTTTEGRWFADLILLFVGGQGNQAVQSITAFVLLAITGLLLGELFRIDGRWPRVLAALVFAVNPTIIDYFAFSVDQIGFSLGDLLIVASALALDRLPHWRGIVIASLGLVFALAIYPPKISLVAVTFLSWLINRAFESPTLREFVRRSAFPAASSIIAGVGLYYLTVLLIGVPQGSRTAVDSLSGMLASAAKAYSEFAVTIVQLTSPLPLVGQIGFWITLSLAIFTLFSRGLAARPHSWATVVILLLLLPMAARASNIVNPATWEHSGRVATGYAVLFAALCSWALAAVGVRPVSATLRLVAIVASAALAHGCVVIATRETAYLAMKTAYDVQKINRIVARLEQYISRDEQVALVVIGDLEFQLAGLFLPDGGTREFRPQMSLDTFQPYRQVELVNFFMGRSAVVAPSGAEVAAAIAAALNRPPWPDLNSVFLLDKTAVVILDRYDPSQPVTWTR
jgi:hypothetical protein